MVAIFKTYLEGRTKRPSPLWDDLEGSKKASIDLRALLGDSVFSNPKPVGLIRRIIQILPKPNDSSIVMDFFAGSGTTAQAVLESNLHDSGNRRYIWFNCQNRLTHLTRPKSQLRTFANSMASR